MPIDLKAFERDEQAIIDDMPSKMRYDDNKVIYKVAFESNSFALMLMEGGLPANATGKVWMVRSKWVGRPPEQRKKLAIQQRNGKWFEFEIKNIPDLTDPNAVTYTFEIGPPDF